MKWKQKCGKILIAAAAVIWLVTGASAAETKMLIPGGHTIGMKAFSRGLVVTGVEAGSPAEKAGIRQGDIITQIQGEPLKSVGQLVDRMTDGTTVELQLDRGRKTLEVSVCPEWRTSEFKLGAYVRDNIAGIGTVSYYDPENGTFGALGHGISDTSGSGLLPISGGVLLDSTVREVQKSVSGTAGQLKGSFDVSRTVGKIVKNTDSGVFGIMPPPEDIPALPVAAPEQVQPGPAVIYANVCGDLVEEYDIEILKCYCGSQSTDRNLLIRVVDPDLLAVTGGIVQGMSGSPIIQDGKLVGAVTHVLVNDPTRGYGIFIENMLDAAG